MDGLLPLDLGISLLDFGRSLVCHSLSFRVAGSHARQPKIGRFCPEGAIGLSQGF